MTLAVRLAGKTAAQTIAKMLEIFENVPAPLRSSITFDNDMTFSKHMLLTQQLSIKTYFCDAYASWQKGGIENANGRLRRWLPSSIDLDTISDKDMQDIVLAINTTPCKCLGF